jgi:RimJ/RimL family protein N-acetyltransferase
MNENAETSSVFTGKLVKLVAYDPEKFAQQVAIWNQNSEYQQLLNSDPARLWTVKEMKDWLEKHLDELYGFTIHKLDDGAMIGMVDFSGIDWTAGSSWVGIGIGDPEYWGKGYGTEAMRLILNFGFGHLNLRRVTLNVFEYNQRAIRSYEKCGFKVEGRLREWMVRGGERFDLIFMGILREDWEAIAACAPEVAQEQAR